MQIRRRDLFITIQTEGAILPSDLLQRVADGDKDLEGLTPESYHLSGEKLNEAINRSWNRLTGAWAAFRSATAKLGQTNFGTSETRERWLLPLFEELKYGRLPGSKAVEIEGKAYPISHAWQNTPIHLVGCGVDLDRRAAGVKGAAQASPHSLVQEFLNRSKGHLWGFVSNGHQLRILRDNVSLTRQAYVEFDLQAMMDGEIYSDFVVLWLLAHQSRVEGDRPELCWLEKWSQSAQKHGTRALDFLRNGVEEAIKALGSGFLAHTDNKPLREKLRSGTLDKQDYYRQLLRTVYRLLFLFVAEDRNLLLDPKADAAARDRYTRFYSTSKLRHLSERRRGTQHTDLWRGLSLVFGKLGDDQGCPALALPALGSFLWSDSATPDLTDCDIANHDLLSAIRSLAFITEKGVRRSVDYKNLGSEELGSIYESLLELHPQLNLDAPMFDLSTVGGNERKTTGSHYTPTALIIPLLDSALDPVLDEACRKPHPEKAILNLNVCDPAVGSGHFLIAAAHRIAKRLASIRSDEAEPSPESLRKALRDVIGHCLYGVDSNPMAVELCKISLWMEALEPGKPLSFLDHHIRWGNSLLGATSELIAKGIPDEAYTPIEGDDRQACSELRKLNKRERQGFGELFVREDQATLQKLQQAADALEALPDDKPEQVRQKADAFARNQTAYDFQNAKRLADTWCAAFVMGKNFKPGTTDLVGLTQRHINSLADGHSLPNELTHKVEKLASSYTFFHWHLAFPEVFVRGGFDVVLGNPPWDMVELSEKEFFASRDSQIADASSARQRQRMIAALESTQPRLFHEFNVAKRDVDGHRQFFQSSGRFPSSSVGRINLYPLFSECVVSLLGVTGRAGIIVPSAISMDAYNATFFTWLLENRRLISLFDFENSGAFFDQVHRSYRFCLLTLCGKQTNETTISFCYFAHDVSELQNPKRRIILRAEDIRLFSPNTLAPPILLNEDDTRLAKHAYSRWGVFLDRHSGKVSSWKPSIQRMLSLSDEGDMFRRAEELQGCRTSERESEWWRLYSGKAIHAYNHRFASFDGSDWQNLQPNDLLNPGLCIATEYYVKRGEVAKRIGGKYPKNWLIGYRDIARATDERTSIAAIIPQVGCDTHCRNIYTVLENPILLSCLISNLNSFVFDYFARQKIIGTGMGATTLEQLPVVSTDSYVAQCPWNSSCGNAEWIASRVLELTYTAWDLDEFAKDCGHHGPPFRWDEERRFLLRCELDAAYFHLYGLVRADAAYILDTFPIVKRKDEAKFGTYRTKDQILAIYDAMQIAMATGAVLQTLLDPPPADPRCAHPPKQIPILAPSWMDRPMVLPTSRRVVVAPDRYRATLVPHLLYQAGGNIPFERFRKAYWLLTEPRTLERYATGAVGPVAHKWLREFRDTLHKDMFIEHLKGAVGRQLHFVRKANERWLELRDPKVADDEHVIFDARLALLVADLWPDAEQIAPLATADEIAIQQLEGVS